MTRTTVIKEQPAVYKDMNPRMFLTRRPRVNEPETLLLRWKHTSITSCWLYEEDWDRPQTRALVTAYTQQHSLTTPARELGWARAMQGAGITETIEDLKAFFAATNTRIDPAVLQSLTEGWVTATEQAPAASCTDPRTGLSTAEHFKRILHDTCNGHTTHPHDYVMARIHVPSAREGTAQGWPELAELGACCQRAFKDSTATLTYQPNTLTILMPRTPENYLRILSCHTEITTYPSRPAWAHAGLSYEPLPTTDNSIMQLLDSLAR